MFEFKKKIPKMMNTPLQQNIVTENNIEHLNQNQSGADKSFFHIAPSFDSLYDSEKYCDIKRTDENYESEPAILSGSDSCISGFKNATSLLEDNELTLTNNITENECAGINNESLKQYEKFNLQKLQLADFLSSV